MIHFSPLTSDDIYRIRNYAWIGDRRGCDLSVANLIGWQFLFNTQIAEVDGQLVFRLHFFGDLAYIVPVFDIEVIKALMEDSASLGQPFLMSGVTAQMAQALEAVMPGVFDVDGNRDYSDYVYFREKLENLSGKKLQSKRNHINKFLSLYPQYVYKPLTKEMIPDCLCLEKRWKAGQDDDGQADSQNMELRAMTRVFHRWDELGMSGGTIWVDGRLVAFTYGCPINHDTFDVCVEKANVAYEGAYTIINREFVRHLPEQFRYINREEDMGEEGLRKAKLSYRPDILQEKLLVREKSHLRQNGDSEAIRLECAQLWRDTFRDPEEYVETYFSKIYRSEDNVCIKSGGKVIAALQTIPFTMLCSGNELQVSYISGVAVKDEYRGQNIGAELMHQAHYNLYNRKVAFAVLIPAEPWLREWYGRLGYASCIECVSPPAEAYEMCWEEWAAFLREQRCALLAGREWFSVAQEELRCSGGQTAAPVTGMVRIIDAFQALQLYASLHPAAELRLRVTGDDVIPTNNAYFTFSAGKVLQSEEPDESARKITLADLTDLIFADLDATMTLMLN